MEKDYVPHKTKGELTKFYFSLNPGDLFVEIYKLLGIRGGSYLEYFVNRKNMEQPSGFEAYHLAAPGLDLSFERRRILTRMGTML